MGNPCHATYRTNLIEEILMNSHEKHDVEIVLNGTETQVNKGHYTFEQLYALAYPNLAVPTGKEIPITYTEKKGKNPGSLLPGESVEVKEGMVFNVRSNTKS